MVYKLSLLLGNSLFKWVTWEDHWSVIYQKGQVWPRRQCEKGVIYLTTSTIDETLDANFTMYNRSNCIWI